jgi:hypothetical protein
MTIGEGVFEGRCRKGSNGKEKEEEQEVQHGVESSKMSSCTLGHLGNLFLAGDGLFQCGALPEAVSVGAKINDHQRRSCSSKASLNIFIYPR